MQTAPNLDTVFIDELLLRTVIGVEDWERKILQDVKISLVLTVDTKKAALSDDIKDAAHYRHIAEAITNVVESSKCHLIEKLANDVAKHVLQNFDVHAVKVRLEKPGALRHTKTIGIEISRFRSDF